MEKNTESTRQLKVAKEIQKEMAEIIRRKGMARRRSPVTNPDSMVCPKTARKLRLAPSARRTKVIITAALSTCPLSQSIKA